jgi:hypothetical protein
MLRVRALSLHKIAYTKMLMGGRNFLRTSSILHVPGLFGGKLLVFIQNRPV